MFQSIVVGTDGSSRARGAVQAAAEMAKAHGATLHLVQAYRPSSQYAAALPAAEGLAVMSPLTDAELHDDVSAGLDNLAGELKRDGIKVECHACGRAAASALLDIASSHDADLIVVGDKGMHGARRVLGSVPNTVAHQASCAVMIVPTGSA
jgi:nucleotide-binding universal stress UspA family protein